MAKRSLMARAKMGVAFLQVLAAPGAAPSGLAVVSNGMGVAVPVSSVRAIAEVASSVAAVMRLLVATARSHDVASDSDCLAMWEPRTD